MNIEQLQTGLLAKFEHSRIVFWHDAERNFYEAIAALSMPDGVLVCVENVSMLALKKRLELDEPNTRFLLYCPFEVPEAEDDWLLDIRLYSETFYADVSSMILHDLGITQMALRSHISQRLSFFSNKQRVAKLKRWITEQETASALDRKMIAVLLKAESASVNDVLLAALAEYVKVDHSSETMFAELAKFGLTDAFMALLEQEFAFAAEEPMDGLRQWLMGLFCTDVWGHTDAGASGWLQSHVFKTPSAKANAMAFMKNWRHNGLYKDDYHAVASQLQASLEIESRYNDAPVLALVECETFEGLERVIIRQLVRELMAADERFDREAFKRYVSARLLSHWVRENADYQAIYFALEQAEQLFALRRRFADGFYYDSAAALFKAYQAELFAFDQHYRLFNEYAQVLFNKGSEILRALDESVERVYSEWYLNALSLAWDGLLEQESRLSDWQLPGLVRQADFYQQQIAPLFKTTQLKRVFVVISDALRFEVAEEFSEKLNARKQFKASLGAQLGVLPSYTQLGMASLLPHDAVSYADNGTTVLVDGLPTNGLANRDAILKSVNGMAVSAKELMTWSNQEGREKVRDASVVYIYHNTIDDICDKQGGEDRTPEVCRDAIEELTHLAGRIINRLNGSRVIVTADHGFLFQQKPLESADKTALQSKPKGASEAKKRYILGQDLPEVPNCWRGQVSQTANGQDDTAFLLPKGIQRFHFVGGAKFVHGGASLQEVCVPVITITELEGKKIQAHQKPPVGVVVLRQPIKFVNNIDKLALLQSDPVGESYQARDLEVFIVDAAGERVSSCETLRFDSEAESMDARTREVKLKLVGASFDRRLAYKLVLQDPVTKVNYSEYPVTIDLAFLDEF